MISSILTIQINNPEMTKSATHKPQYWVGRQSIDGPLLIVDTWKPMPPTLEEVQYFSIDLDAGAVTVVGVIDPTLPDRKWLREIDEGRRDEAQRVLILWRSTLLKETQERANEQKHLAEVRRNHDLKLAKARAQLVEVLTPNDFIDFTVELPQVPKSELGWLIGWCPAGVQAELRQFIAAGLPSITSLQKLSKAAHQQLTRICAARAAELGVMQWFHEHGFIVEDTAVTQRTGSSDDWQTHDLLVAPQSNGSADVPGIPVDVKNARRPEGKSSLAMRLMVRATKLSQGRDVKLLGILSPYVTLEQLVAHAPGGSTGMKATILGWTDEPRLQGIESLCSRTGLRFQSVDHSRTMLAPWAFEMIELPDNNTDDIQLSSNDLDHQLQLAELDELQDAAFNYRLKRELLAPHAPNAWFPLLSKLAARCEQNGFTLPVLYVTLVQHFLEVIQTPGADFSRAEWLRVLYVFEITATPEEGNTLNEDLRGRARRIQNPFGIFDPIGSVAHLVFALDSLWKRAKDHLHKYEALELYGNGLVRGVYGAGGRHRETVLAYCGGFSAYGPCGRFPLLAGQHKRCPEGFLTCDKCGYCCELHKRSRSVNDDAVIIDQFLEGLV